MASHWNVKYWYELKKYCCIYSVPKPFHDYVIDSLQYIYIYSVPKPFNDYVIDSLQYIYIYITNLVCYAYFHWLFNPECQHIFGKQTGYICTFSVSLIWAKDVFFVILHQFKICFFYLDTCKNRLVYKPA
jgi:hypothetical protein